MHRSLNACKFNTSPNQYGDRSGTPARDNKLRAMPALATLSLDLYALQHRTTFLFTKPKDFGETRQLSVLLLPIGQIHITRLTTLATDLPFLQLPTLIAPFCFAHASASQPLATSPTNSYSADCNIPDPIAAPSLLRKSPTPRTPLPALLPP